MTASGRVGSAETGSHPADHAPAGHGGSRFDPARIENIGRRLSDLERKAMLHREGASEACMSWATAQRLHEIGLTERNARFLRLTPLGKAARTAIQEQSK